MRLLAALLEGCYGAGCRPLFLSFCQFSRAPRWGLGFVLLWKFAIDDHFKGFGQFEYRRRRVVKESGAYQIFLGGAARAYSLVTYNGGTGFEGLGLYGNVFQNGIRAKYTGVAKARAYVNLAVSKDVEAAARHYCTWRGRCACPCSVSVA